jgi:hypothetical protein
MVAVDQWCVCTHVGWSIDCVCTLVIMTAMFVKVHPVQKEREGREREREERERVSRARALSLARAKKEEEEEVLERH